MSGGSICTNGPNNTEGKVFGSHSFRHRTAYFNQHCFRFVLWQALSRQNVLHLAGANSKRQHSKASVSAGMTVATHYRHSGLSQAQLRADHVHNSLFCRVSVDAHTDELVTLSL